MSETIVIDSALRESVAGALRKMSAEFPRSIASAIKSANWDEVIEAVCRVIDVTSDDQEIALIVATARAKEKLPHAFTRYRANRGGQFGWK